MPRLPCRSVLVASLALAVLAFEARAQQIAVPSPPPRAKAVDALVQDLKNHLEAMGYNDIKLTPGAKGIDGTALKEGQRVKVGLDGKGRIYTGGH
ncbi:MAG: hypothetical protein HQL37_13230 [Alphaproteobacteria bacterium]|nr:hypothetical protein [Alphaproteobacteria bacterium]